jgi:hypothetical protein
MGGGVSSASGAMLTNLASRTKALAKTTTKTLMRFIVFLFSLAIDMT